MALRTFGLTPDDQARLLELVEGRETALAHVGIMEDSVIEHDARHIPGYDLVQSDLTGRAVFERGAYRCSCLGIRGPYSRNGPFYQKRPGCLLPPLVPIEGNKAN